MPALDLFAISSDPDRLDSVGGAVARAAILSAADAIERFVVAACVSLGLPQLTALAEPADGDVACSSFSRTPKAKAMSVRTMREWLCDRVSAFIHGVALSPMARFIRERLALEGGYAPRGATRAVTKAQVTPV